MADEKYYLTLVLPGSKYVEAGPFDGEILSKAYSEYLKKKAGTSHSKYYEYIIKKSIRDIYGVEWNLDWNKIKFRPASWPMKRDMFESFKVKDLFPEGRYFKENPVYPKGVLRLTDLARERKGVDDMLRETVNHDWEHETDDYERGGKSTRKKSTRKKSTRKKSTFRKGRTKRMRK
jgi:hypothetical protein